MHTWLRQRRDVDQLQCRPGRTAIQKSNGGDDPTDTHIVPNPSLDIRSTPTEKYNWNTQMKRRYPLREILLREHLLLL